MGWGTWTNAEIYFSKETYDTKSQVKAEKENCKNLLRQYEKELYAYAITDINIHLNETDCEGNKITFTNFTSIIENLLEEIEELSIKLYKLDLLLDNWEQRDGDYIKKEEDVKNET